MYSEKIEKLMMYAITDGIITEKERELLLKKADEEGIDLDEFQMVIEAKLYERQQELANTNCSTTAQPELKYSPSKPKSEVERCPACNDILQQFNASCSSCGYEIRQENIDSVVKRLLLELSELETSKKNIGNSALLSAFSDSNTEGDSNVNAKCELINKCIIPNTKFEILSFLSISIPLSRIKQQKSSWSFLNGGNSSEDKLSTAWRKKSEQVIIQCQFSMQADKKAYEKIMQFSKELEL